MNVKKTHKLALLGAFAIALLVPQQAQAWQWPWSWKKTAAFTVTTAVVGSLYYLWLKAVQLSKEYDTLLANTHHFLAIYSVNSKLGIKADISADINEMKRFWLNHQTRKIAPTKKRYDEYIEYFFNREATTYSQRCEVSAEVLKKSYYNMFHCIIEAKKEQQPSVQPTQYTLNFDN